MKSSSAGRGLLLVAVPVVTLVTVLGCVPSTPAAEQSPARVPSQAPAAVESVAIPGTSMVIDRPSAWWMGGSSGVSVLLSYIGTGNGYPAFAIQTDAEVNAQPAEAAERAIEDLFDAIAGSRDSNQVVFANWIEINGIRAHSSLMTFSSIAGTITVRRLLIAHRGQPYIFSWTAREADYASIETLVEWCAHSLRVQAAEATPAG